MSMAFHLKLIQPKELPKDTLTSAEFKPWTNHLINFLQQDVNNFLYLPGGIYEKWLPADEVVANMRIAQLDDNDDDLDAIAAGADNATEKTRKKRVLLKTRNAQLGRMIQHIVSFVHYNEANDIGKSSKSVEWIFKYLRQHYNIEPKGANFLRITEQTYKSGMLPQVFYKQFKASFVENLRKKGETLNHKGGKVLAEDEVLTPSFEDAIILWALEKIDVRLPQKVRRDYEHRLSGGTYLIDLQVTIFQSIPTMIEELNKQAEVNASPLLTMLRSMLSGHIRDLVVEDPVVEGTEVVEVRGQRGDPGPRTSVVCVIQRGSLQQYISHTTQVTVHPSTPGRGRTCTLH